MNLYNTLTKTKESLIPREDKKIQMFVCGPTVYDFIHIGNARTFVFFDVVAKYLRSQGYEVNYIQNITDIDDKIINRAKENNRESLEWAKEYFENFKTDMSALGVDSPRYILATEHIEQVIKQVKTLIDKGHAYLIDGDGWYFDLSTFKEYGKLSRRTALMADDAVTRIDENDKKRNRGDFCLWKLSKAHSTRSEQAGEPSWDSELGQGRPGWHIEDTAITEHYFGPQYDIHGGGQDLIFPHHEAEITQQESASGKKPFVKYWMHVAFLINKDQKMSKSLGNFNTANELLIKYSKEVLRFYILSSHYRSPLDLSDKMFLQSQAAVNRISDFAFRLSRADGTESEYANIALSEARSKFTESMNDDFNTPEAFASIFELIKKLNPLAVENKLDKKQASLMLAFLNDIDSVLGIVRTEQQKIPAKVQELIDKRETFRQEKNYEESDRIRAEILTLGWAIEDTIYGPLAVKKD